MSRSHDDYLLSLVKIRCACGLEVYRDPGATRCLTCAAVQSPRVFITNEQPRTDISGHVLEE